jgi:hypothetical protein
LPAALYCKAPDENAAFVARILRIVRLVLAACSLGVIAFASALAVIVALQAGVYGSGSGIRIDSSLVVLARAPAWL